MLYFALVAGAYRATDMSLAYPLMRGLAPALVALVGVAFLGEHLTPAAWAGVALVSGGVFGMTLADRGRASRAGTLLALLNAGVIATYTLIDGAGVRRSGAPVAYAMWLFLLNAVPLVAWALLARRRALLAYARAQLAPRPRRRPRQPRLLRPRALGDDRRAGRRGRGAARDLDPLRHGDRRPHPAASASARPASPPPR